MIYLKWLWLASIKFALLLTLPVAVPVVSAFTRAMPQDLDCYTWGALWGTFDNPPQGDENFVANEAFFPDVLNGWRGYVNRCQWIFRNKLYGFNRWAALDYDPCTVSQVHGNPNISDKYKVAGWYFVQMRDVYSWQVIGFEFYGVFPYTLRRDVRVRLGWKMLSDKFAAQGFAPLVTTLNPFDGYGNE